MTTTAKTTKKEDWEKDLPLHWYTLALILILILQVFICCCIYMWAKSKLKKIEEDKQKSEKEFFAFLVNFNRMMKLEED